MQRIEFFVEDTPRPGGSKRAFYNPKVGRAIVVDASSKVKTWRNTVRFTARGNYDGPPLKGAVRMDVTFSFRRPKSHYGTGRNARRLKPSAPRYHTQKPDLTKLVRSTEDALKGIIWEDDCQRIGGEPTKGWVDRWEREGALIVIESLTAENAENAEAAE